jgi:tetratricopeptide (TPR) repeat protein/TolB-like protein
MNLDGSEETQIFADGLMEDVITQLSRVPGLRVASRGDSATMAPNSASQAVRERLRVKRYLEGSVEMNSEEMRVTVQLINAEDGFHVLSRRFDRPRKDFFDVRDEITSLTVANVRVALPNGLQVSSLRPAEDPSLDAYVLYRRGIDASRQPASVDAISAALGWFDAALTVDPEYAAAHAGKCSVYVDGYSEFDDASYVELAESACARALSISPNLDIVHTALGDLYRLTGRINDAELAYQQALAIDSSNADSLTGLGQIYARQNRLDEAEASLRQAIEAHPGNWQTYNKLGFFFFQLGRFEEAAEQFQYVAGLVPDEQQGHTNLGSAYMMMGDFEAAAPAFQRAIDIRPITIVYSNLGLMQYYLGDLDAAIESHSNAVALQPGDHLARSNLGDALWVAGRYDEARLEFEKAEQQAENAMSVNPNDPYTMMDLAWISTNIDKNDKARALIDRALMLAPDDPYTHYYDALILVRADDLDAALAAIAAAVERGYSRKMLAADPQLQALREEPEFRAAVADQ